MVRFRHLQIFPQLLFSDIALCSRAGLVRGHKRKFGTRMFTHVGHIVHLEILHGYRPVHRLAVFPSSFIFRLFLAASGPDIDKSNLHEQHRRPRCLAMIIKVAFLGPAWRALTECPLLAQPLQWARNVRLGWKDGPLRIQRQTGRSNSRQVPRFRQHRSRPLAAGRDRMKPRGMPVDLKRR